MPPSNGPRLSCGASAGGRKRPVLRYLWAGAQMDTLPLKAGPVSFKRLLGGPSIGPVVAGERGGGAQSHELPRGISKVTRQKVRYEIHYRSEGSTRRGGRIDG